MSYIRCKVFILEDQLNEIYIIQQNIFWTLEYRIALASSRLKRELWMTTLFNKPMKVIRGNLL